MYGYRQRPTVGGRLASILPDSRLQQPARLSERAQSDRYRFDRTLSLRLESVEASVLDGTNSSTPAAWATMHALTDADTENATFNTAVGITAHTVSSEWAQLSRGILQFETGAVYGDQINPTGAILHLFIASVTDSLSQSLVISNATSGGTITTADFDQLGSTDYNTPRINLSVLSSWVGRYKAFVLDPVPEDVINPSGVTLLGVWLSGDADDSEPSWSSGATSSVLFGASDSAYPPYLEVTFNG